jgi:hypothetical protein
LIVLSDEPVELYSLKAPYSERSGKVLITCHSCLGWGHLAEQCRYKSNWAKEYLARSGSIKEREAWADYKLDDVNYEYKIAEALVKTKREALLSIRTSIDAMRTLNANVRIQV